MSNTFDRRDFMKTATAMAAAGGLPTLETLTRIAHAAGPVTPSEVGNEYKAMVIVFLYGGQDHANIVIPYEDGNAAGTGGAGTFTEFTRYATDRSNNGDTASQSTSTGNLAHTRAQLAGTRLTTSAGTAPTTNFLTGTANPTAGGWTTNTYGRMFALNPNMTELHSLYNAGNLAIIANVGPMLSPITRDQWYRGTGGPRPLNLYSHDDQQKGWMSGTSGIANPNVGIGGRIAANPVIRDLNRTGTTESKVSTQISINGVNTFMLSESGAPPGAIAYQMGTGALGRLTDPTTCNTNNPLTSNTSFPFCLSGGPVRISNGYSWNATLMNAAVARYAVTPEGVSIYHDQWRGIMRQSINTEQAISAAFLASPTTEDILTPFNVSDQVGDQTNWLSRQLRMVAAMIRASNQLGPTTTQPIKRQIFFVGIGGFDTHGREFWRDNPRLNQMISKAIFAFWQALGQIRVVNAAGTGLEPPSVTARSRVTLMTMSEFGRTLDSNGDGSDHGWGNFQFVLGGAVNGRNIFGQSHNVTTVPATTPIYMEVDNTAGAMPRIGLPPNPYSGTTRIANRLNHSLNRGELLATTASDAMVATVAKWFGVPVSAMTGPTGVFPTLAAVHGSNWDMGFMQPT